MRRRRFSDVSSPCAPVLAFAACLKEYAPRHRKRNEEGKMAAFHDITMNTITGEPLSFEKYKGAACLVVNLASQ